MNLFIERRMEKIFNDHVVSICTQAAARKHTIAKDISCEHFFSVSWDSSFSHMTIIHIKYSCSPSPSGKLIYNGIIFLSEGLNRLSLAPEHNKQ